MRSALATLILILTTTAWAAPDQMKGVQVGEGGALSVREMPVPKPGAGEVLVKVRAAGVNPVDWKVAGGRVGQVPGTDVSGVIDTLGTGVSGWKIGEPVLGFARQSGSYAEYAVIPATSLARKPASLSFEQAAGVPIAAETAYRALHEAGGIRAGQTVLIHGAAGGVGSAAVQVAKAAGARVIGTASANNLEFLKSIGVDQVIDYRSQKFEDVVTNVDLVLNTANAETNARSIGIVKEGGTLVSIVGAADAAACAAAKIRCVRPDRNTGATNAQLLAKIGELADAGKFTVHVDDVIPMTDAARAWEKSREGHTRGKLIIQVSAGPTMKHRGDLPILQQAAQRLAVTRGVPLDSLEYQATGQYFQFGQAPAPELPWPEFTVDSYLATLDFARAAVHAKYHRVQVQEPGRARPHSEQTQDQYARDGVTWNLAPGPVAMPANLGERSAELWASPQGFVKAALAHQAQVEQRGDGITRVRFTLGKARYEGELDRNNDVVRVSTYIDSPVLGDTPIEFRYSGYDDFDGTRFPRVIERRVAGLPWYKLSVSQVRVNQAQPFAVPAEIAANPTPSVARIEVSELAPGVLLFGGGTHNSVIVQQGAGILVIEAPLGEARSLAILAAIHQRFAGKPILGVVNTHTHFDHAGGLRTFVAEGIPVITQERNAAYFEKAWMQPRTLDPDRLAKSPRRASFRTFTDQLLLDDADRPVELLRIEGSGHNDAFVMAYLPKQRLLVEADAWTPTPPGAKPPTVVNPLWINLDDNVRRLKLDVARIAPLHGAPRTYDDLREAIGKR